jgi:lipopolysaccharide/colanic/teichoic acid biosynthesis glycosyltransferase
MWTKYRYWTLGKDEKRLIYTINKMYKIFIKRIIDVFLSLIALLLFSPVLLITIFFLYKQNKGKVFFFQERPGMHQKPFNIIKFKSMTDEKDVDGNLLPDIERITKFGAIVRKLSIDELPQLINVLQGDMSLVGPRPLLFKYIPLYSEGQLRRHEVRPGITGWAQVSGRNSISWTRKFELDIEYVDKVSLWFDIKILMLTIKKVLIREGVNQTDERPMQPFNGNN